MENFSRILQKKKQNKIKTGRDWVLSKFKIRKITAFDKFLRFIINGQNEVLFV